MVIKFKGAEEMEIGYVILVVIIFTFVGYGIYATNKYLNEKKD